MRYRTYILFGIVIGILAVAVTWVWLSLRGPCWRRPGEGLLQLQPSAKHERVLITAHLPEEEGRDPALRRWDWTNGEPLERVVLHTFELGPAKKNVRVNAGLKFAVVTVPSTPPERDLNRVMVFDAETGNILLHPTPSSVVDGSPDGRWIAIYSERRPGWVEVRSTQRVAGPAIKVFHREPNVISTDHHTIDALCFAPGGQALAVLSHHSGKFFYDQRLDVFELPSGRRIGGFTNDDLVVRRIRGFEGNTLALDEDLPGHAPPRPSHVVRHQLEQEFEVDMKEDAQGRLVFGRRPGLRKLPDDLLLEDQPTDRRVLLDYGEDWVAHCEEGVEDLFDPFPRWLSKWFRSMPGGSRNWTVSLRERPGDVLRCKVPVVQPRGAVFHPEGKYLACVSEDGGLEVWDLTPRSTRLPSMIIGAVAGVLAGLMLLWIRSRNNNASSQPDAVICRHSG